MADKPDGKLDRARSEAPSGLQRRLAAGEFAVTAEIGPPRGADTAPVARTAALLRDWVDAVNITDNQSAAVRLSSRGGQPDGRALVISDVDRVDPVPQQRCRPGDWRGIGATRRPDLCGNGEFAR